MKKIAILVLLLCFIVGCDEEILPDAALDVNEGLVWIIDSGTTSADIMFSGDGPDVIFNWEDGKFDIIYDANNCTQSAKTFIDCMLPYLNEHIETKAKELIRERFREKLLNKEIEK